MSLGLYGLADHAVREALSRFGGLVVHALHADRGGRLDLFLVYVVLLIMQFAVHFLALAV
jgi:hypothetical protein